MYLTIMSTSVIYIDEKDQCQRCWIPMGHESRVYKRPLMAGCWDRDNEMTQAFSSTSQLYADERWGN